MTNAERIKSGSQLDLQMISVGLLSPNPWNPNRMTTEEFEAYRAEVQRLGRLPKPVVVRPAGERYTILDGEHGWRAAQENGFAEVPCEIIQVDDFDGRRETFCRNQHGTHDKVREGRMFQWMLDEGLNQTQLAEELKVSEGTVRNALLYVEAADIRKAYAGESRDAEIAAQSVKNVRIYLALPQEIGNIWLNIGAWEQHLEPYMEEGISGLFHVLNPIVTAGLVGVLVPKVMEFGKSLDYAYDLSQWREAHDHLENVDGYLRSVAELRMPVIVLDLLPCRVVDHTTEPLLSVERWDEILRDCDQRAGNQRALYRLLECSVHVELKKAGVDLGKIYGPYVARMLQAIDNGPAFIRDADGLTVKQKYQLLQMTAGAAAESELEAKLLVCQQVQRESQAGQDPHERHLDRNGDLTTLFQDALTQLQRRQKLQEEDRRFADPDRLREAFVAEVCGDCVLQSAVVAGRPAPEVAAERLRGLPTPELILVAALLDPSTIEDPFIRWLAAMGKEVAAEPK